jgi:hypothetical protein
VVFAGALFSAYTMYIHGYWFFFRYFYVIGVVVQLCTALALDHAVAMLKTTQKSAALYGSASLFFVVVIARSEPAGPIDITSGPRSLRGIYTTADPVHRPWMNMGLWAENHFAPGTIIGCRDSGAVGYFAESLTVVNLDGVVNHDAYEAMLTHRLLDYARSVKVEHVLVWDGTLDFLRAETASFREEDLVFERDLDFESLGRPWHLYRLAAR